MDQGSRIITQEQARQRWLDSFKPRDGKKYFSSGFKTHDQAGKFLRSSQIRRCGKTGSREDRVFDLPC